MNQAFAPSQKLSYLMPENIHYNNMKYFLMKPIFKKEIVFLILLLSKL